MKKLRLVFMLLAVFIASVSVFATRMNAVTTLFYINNSSAGTTWDCDTQVTGVCNSGMGDQCDLSTQGGSAPVFKRENAGDCEIYRKPV